MNGKASSVFDSILNEYFKRSEVVMLSMFCKLLSIILDSGIFPEIWSKGVILPLYKNMGNVNDTDNYRDTNVVNCFGRPFTAVLNNRLNNYLKSYAISGEEQAGFRKK
jgi:hypothetical protein